MFARLKESVDTLRREHSRSRSMGATQTLVGQVSLPAARGPSTQLLAHLISSEINGKWLAQAAGPR